MSVRESVPSVVEEFIRRWEPSGAGERANYVSFINELCEVLGVPRPDPAREEDAENAYVYERAVTFRNPDGTSSTGRIDLYRRNCFVLEAKQGSGGEASTEGGPLAVVAPAAAGARRRGRKGTAVRGTRGWDDAMLKAKGQAEAYARALPETEPLPPFLVVVDVGYSIELYSDFARSGKNYLPFPEARGHRIGLRELVREEVRERLRAVWLDPLGLDPSRRSARVTRRVAEQLAELARSLEESGHEPAEVASFLMRAIFTMFAEDVRLLPAGKFTELLERLRGRAEGFSETMRALWQGMSAGGFSPVLMETLLRFNGGLFESADALPLDEAQLALLVEASRADWKDVEPAIFGTLLERALDPLERHKLGAHYTPRAYVERLVLPAVVEPLREEWEAARVAAVAEAKAGRVDEAVRLVREFHQRLCRVRVLDPACGSGNFLYVTLEHMKRIEGEVLDLLETFGERQVALEHTGRTVDPHQLLGLEVNPRAAAIADLVLWIGYLQWHFRTRGNVMPPEPVLQKFNNVECRDAVLAYDRVEPLTDDEGRAVTRWDGRTHKHHPATGEEVPDETARTPVMRYINPRKAEWPEADFIVGNPPFIGGWKIRQSLGDGYVEALWSVYKEIPQKADYVTYWWSKAAEKTRKQETRRFGLITTNSIAQIFQRRVLAQHIDATESPLRLVMAIPDHPWVDTESAAAVRVAMTVGEKRVYDAAHRAKLGQVIEESDDEESVKVKFEEVPQLNSSLSPGVNLDEAVPLASNESICSPGVQLYGAGFIVSPEEVASWGEEARQAVASGVLRLYVNGRDITGNSRKAYVIDFFELNHNQAARMYARLFQRVLDRVKPERDQNRRKPIREKWWRFGWERPVWRQSVAGLSRFITTPETSKHRFFVFLDESILPDNMLINIALDDAYFIGVLTSRIHVTWALAAGGTLEDRPRYNKTRCFEPFPFPDCTDEQKARIRELGEALDAHRKRQQAQHPRLTITDMYNVLERLRAGEPLTDKERFTHEAGLVSVLRQIHDELDAAVFDAYGWPHSLADEEILQRLVRLNAERAREERQGLVRWLRPDFQNPDAAPAQATLGIEDPRADTAAAPAAARRRPSWPKSLPEQVKAVRAALAAHPGDATAAQLARAFTRAPVERVGEILQTLASLGQAREIAPGAGRYVA